MRVNVSGVIRGTGTEGLLERERELVEVARLVDQAGTGRGRLVFVEGPPGIGKTRLLDAVRQRAADGGMLALSARASELDREFPFGVVRQLFEPFLAGLDDDRREALLAGAAGAAGPLVGATPAEEPALAT